MKSLPVLVCFLGLVVLCQGQCFFEMLEITDINHPPTGCVDKDSKEHAFGSKWTTNDCNACFCTKRGMSCCSKIPQPSSMSLPDECVLDVNEAACSYKIVMRADPSKLCTWN